MSYNEYILTIIKNVENLSKLCKEQEEEIKDLNFVINNKDSLIDKLREEIEVLKDEIEELYGDIERLECNNLDFSERS